jgi:hypothetical protein
VTSLSHLTALSYEVPLAPCADLGRAGELRFVPLDRLRIDESYQRSILGSGKANIRRIVENFRWSKFAPLIVSPRAGGLFAIIDGQHRAVAAMLHGKIKTVPALVMKGSVEDEAAAFGVINGAITRVQSLTLFRARVAAGDKKAVGVDRVCKAAGVTVCPYPKKDWQPGETMSPARIEECIDRFGADITTMALRVIVGAKAKDGNAGLVGHAQIIGITSTLYANPKWRQLEPLIQCVSDKGLRDLTKRAAVHQAKNGGALATSLAVLLAEILQAELGAGGGSPGKVKTLAMKKREDGRRSNEVLRAMQRDAARPAKAIKPDTSVADQAAIALHLKTKGARKFEAGATGDAGHMMDWLQRVCGIPCSRRPLAGNKGRIYLVGRRKLDLPGLVAVVNEERGKRKLQPITSGG